MWVTLRIGDRPLRQTAIGSPGGVEEPRYAPQCEKPRRLSGFDGEAKRGWIGRVGTLLVSQLAKASGSCIPTRIDRAASITDPLVRLDEVVPPR